MTRVISVVSLRKGPIKGFVLTKPNRVVPRSLALAPDRGWEFFILNRHSFWKGGGPVEADLSDLDLLLNNLSRMEQGLVELTPVEIEANDPRRSS